MHVYPKCGLETSGQSTIKLTRHQTNHKRSFCFDLCVSLESIP